MAKLLHVGIGFIGKPIAFTEIQKVFGTSGWARYAPNCWIVSTNESPETLAERIRAVCGTNDSIFVCELNIDNNNGYLNKKIWDWIKEQKLLR